MSAPSDGARADARKRLVESDVIPCYVVIGTKRVTDLTEWLANRIADAKAEGARAVLEAVKGDSKYGTPQQIVANMLYAARTATARFEVGR